MNTKVRYFDNLTDAQIFSGMLHSRGIENRIGGAKHYTTYVVGGTGGDYFIFVDEDDASSAKAILDEALAKVGETKEDVTEVIPASYSGNPLKKAVIFAVLGLLMIPFVFNYYSVI